MEKEVALRCDVIRMMVNYSAAAMDRRVTLSSCDAFL